MKVAAKVTSAIKDNAPKNQNELFNKLKATMFRLEIKEYGVAVEVAKRVVRNLATQWAINRFDVVKGKDIYNSLSFSSGTYIVKLECGYGLLEIEDIKSDNGGYHDPKRNLYVPLWKRDALLAELTTWLDVSESFAMITIDTANRSRAFFLDPKYGEIRQFVTKETYDAVEGAFKNMLAGPDEYTKRNKAFKETVLLYGPPGTGKSTLVRSLAAKYQCNVTVTKPQNISRLWMNQSNKGKPFIVLIEDFDSAEYLLKPEYRTDKSGSISMEDEDYGTFINWLEGIEPLNNVIIILTTNHKEKIIESVIRGGRVNRSVFMNRLTNEQICDFLDDKWHDTVMSYEKPLTISMIPDLQACETEEEFRETVKLLETA